MIWWLWPLSIRSFCVHVHEIYCSSPSTTRTPSRNWLGIIPASLTRSTKPSGSLSRWMPSRNWSANVMWTSCKKYIYIIVSLYKLLYKKIFFFCCEVILFIIYRISSCFSVPRLLLFLVHTSPLSKVYTPLSDGEFQLIRHTLLVLFQDMQIRVSSLLVWKLIVYLKWIAGIAARSYGCMQIITKLWLFCKSIQA